VTGVQAPRLSAGHDRTSMEDCNRIVVVDNGNNDRAGDDQYFEEDEDVDVDVDVDENSQRRTHAFSLCVKNERERLLYTSTSHYVTVYTVTSSSLTNHNRPHSQARFLLMYKGL